MKKLLLIILSFLIMAGVAIGAQNVSDEVSLIERIKNHPDAEKMEGNWYRILIKENISETPFDWRFDVRMISISDRNITIEHRMEQNSGAHPNSSWVIKYTFFDVYGNRTLDGFYKERFISIQNGDAWFRVTVRWPDEFRYPYPTKEGALELYKKELEYWENKL